MKKLLALLFLLITLSACEKGEVIIAQSVPDTDNFSLFDVLDAVYGSHASGNLASAFADSDAAKFDSNYGSKDMNPQTLLGFRNYGGTPTNVFDDWYLPTITEHASMYGNLGPAGSHNFISDNYWSSTQYDSNNAWAINYNTGNIGPVTKVYLSRVRPIRAFTSISPSYNIGDVGPSGGFIFYKSINDYKEATAADFTLWHDWGAAVTACDNLIIYH